MSGRFAPEDIGDDVLVTIHIEPRAIRLLQGVPVAEGVLQQVKTSVQNIAVTVPSVVSVHHIQAHSAPDSIAVHFHCLFSADTPVRVAHEATVQLEQRLRAGDPAIDRIVIHVEPVMSSP